MTPNNRPRPYSTLHRGRIVWVAPADSTLSPRLRSRRENDDEVRARLKVVVGLTYSKYSGKELDEQLKYWGLPARGWVDES